MFAKVFNQIFDSSIVEDPELRFTFMDLLVLADAGGVVDMTHEAIARRTNRPLETIRKTILILESPDERSRTPDESGRRLKRLDEHRDWGWLIINYERFRKTASEEQRREKTAARVAKYKAKLQQNSLTNAPLTLANAANAMQRQRQKQKEKEKEGCFAPSRRFSDGWLAAYKEVFGQAYIYSTKDGVQAARLLKSGVTPDDALAIARAAWVKSDEKKFWACVNQSKEIPKFVAAFNAIRRELAVDGLACGVKKPTGLPPRRITNGNY